MSKNESQDNLDKYDIPGTGVSDVEAAVKRVKAIWDRFFSSPAADPALILDAVFYNANADEGETFYADAIVTAADDEIVFRPMQHGEYDHVSFTGDQFQKLVTFFFCHSVLKDAMQTAVEDKKRLETAVFGVVSEIKGDGETAVSSTQPGPGKETTEADNA